MSGSKTVYLNVNRLTEVHEKEVFLKDIGTIYCGDSHVENRCNAMKVKTIREKEDRRYVGDVLDLIRKMEDACPGIQVNNIGEVQYIISYHASKKPKLWQQWVKTMFVCIVAFFGAGFAIMTFNNDVSVTDVFKEIYLIVTGEESSGFTVLEVSYSIGLFLGITGFFNHMVWKKINTDPTPLEVEMRLYEENVSKTVIDNDGRKEKEIDVT